MEKLLAPKAYDVLENRSIGDGDKAEPSPDLEPGGDITGECAFSEEDTRLYIDFNHQS